MYMIIKICIHLLLSELAARLAGEVLGVHPVLLRLPLLWSIYGMVYIWYRCISMYIYIPIDR